MDNYSNALSEVYAIIYSMPNDLIMKITTKFKNFVKEQRNKEYNPDINDLVIKNKILPETVVILGFIYSSFLCTEEEKKELEEDKKEYIEKEEPKKEYKSEDLFRNITHEQMQNISETKITVVNKKWYVRIIDYLKRILSIKEK